MLVLASKVLNPGREQLYENETKMLNYKLKFLSSAEIISAE